jgi:hypothetical protein
MATHQLVVKSRSTGHQAPTPEIVVAPFDYAFNANLNTPAGAALATSSTRALLTIGRALRASGAGRRARCSRSAGRSGASGAGLNDLYEIRYYGSGMTAAVCTVRDMLRESAQHAMPA